MRTFPLVLALSIALWAIIVELAVGPSLVVLLGGPPVVIVLAEIAAAVPALVAIP